MSAHELTWIYELIRYLIPKDEFIIINIYICYVYNEMGNNDTISVKFWKILFFIDIHIHIHIYILKCKHFVARL